MLHDSYSEKEQIIAVDLVVGQEKPEDESYFGLRISVNSCDSPLHWVGGWTHAALLEGYFMS